MQRQLNLYGFKCVNRGEDKGAFFHPKFKRGNWEVVKKLTRYVPKKFEDSNGGSSGGSSSSAHAHQNGVAAEAEDEMDEPLQHNSSNVLPLTAKLETPSFQPLMVNNLVDPFMRVPQPPQPVMPQHYHHHVHHPSSMVHHHAPPVFGMDPFSYIESNAYYPNADPLDFWHQWHSAPAVHGNNLYSAPNTIVPYPSTKPQAAMERRDVGIGAIDFSMDRELSISSAKNSASKTETVAPQSDAAMSLATKSTEIPNPKSAVYSVHNRVTINPDFDLEEDFSLFDDIDHHKDFMMNTVRSEPVVKPQMRDAGVNTDLTQSKPTNFYAPFHLFPSIHG